jgi:fatty-acyl-CoA synthase
LKAFVVKKDGSDLDEDTVKKHVKDQLAKYKVPREVIFLDELPRNSTGKILKRELRDEGDEGDDDGGDDGDKGGKSSKGGKSGDKQEAKSGGKKDGDG